MTFMLEVIMKTNTNLNMKAIGHFIIFIFVFMK